LVRGAVPLLDGYNIQQSLNVVKYFMYISLYILHHLLDYI
jgi:hypothetical protein